MTVVLTTTTPDETRALGEALARHLAPGAVVLLEGDLGSGKTVLAKGIGRGLGHDERDVTSPTFTLRNQYPGRRPIEHLDLYRLHDAAEVEDAGLLESDPAAVVLIEWADRFPDCFPDWSLRVHLAPAPGGGRRIELETGPAAGPELAAFLTDLARRPS